MEVFIKKGEKVIKKVYKKRKQFLKRNEIVRLENKIIIF